jgi:putative transposase
MEFREGYLYHIFNCGNNRHPIFFRRSNYLYFLNKMTELLVPHIDLLAWSLVPQHFQMLIHATSVTGERVEKSPIESNRFSEGIRIMLSSYTKAIQVQESYIGNLFHQRTKSECLFTDIRAASVIFNSIHYDPVNENLVKRMEEWEFSSFRDYLYPARPSICNRKLALNLLGVRYDDFRRMENIGKLL